MLSVTRDRTPYPRVPRMYRTLLMSLLLFTAGCRSESVAPPPELTAEEAKTAILELIYSGNLENMQEFPIARYKALPMKQESEKPWLVWGKYEIHLDERNYQFSETREEPPKSTRTMWRGDFVYQDGKWTARIPRLLRTSVSGEEP